MNTRVMCCCFVFASRLLYSNVFCASDDGRFVFGPRMFYYRYLHHQKKNTTRSSALRAKHVTSRSHIASTLKTTYYLWLTYFFQPNEAMIQLYAKKHYVQQRQPKKRSGTRPTKQKYCSFVAGGVILSLTAPHRMHCLFSI